MNNIIPQNYKSMLEEILKQENAKFTTAMCNSIINNVFSSNNDNYLSLINTIAEDTKKHLRVILIKVLETLDMSFKKSTDRNKKYYINKSNIKRTIITIFGEITFLHTYYIDKFSNKKFFYIDNLIGLPKYDHYDPIIKGKAIQLAFEVNQAKAGKIIGKEISLLTDICKNDKLTYIPRQSVYNWIKNWNVPNIKYKERKTPSTLYIMVDEKYIGCQDKDNDIMAKCCVVFEGVDKVGKNRNALKNKLVITANDTSAWIPFTDTIFQVYDVDKIKHIYLMGDGATWIKTGISELKMKPNMTIKFLLCAFHFKQYIHHITTDKDLRKELIDMVLNGKKKPLIKKFNEIIANNPNRKEILIKKTDYILNNFYYIKDMNKSKIGSSMESHISHNIASIFASRPKGYSSDNIDKYLKINDYQNNEINIMDLYLKTYNNTEAITLNQTNINYDIFEKKGSNIPIIDYGKNSSIYHLLNNLSSAI